MSRHTDLVGRLGGEEFAILLPQTQIPAALNAAERLRTTIAATVVNIGSLELRVTASFGVASLAGSDSNFGDLLQRADNALYNAKRSGRNQVVAAA